MRRNQVPDRTVILSAQSVKPRPSTGFLEQKLAFYLTFYYK